MELERNFFTVNDDHTVTLHGWLEERDNNWEGFEDDEVRYTLVTGRWPDVYEPNGADMVDWACPYQQYNEDFHYDEAVELVNTFYDGKPGTYLPMADVNESTPAGDYWE